MALALLLFVGLTLINWFNADGRPAYQQLIPNGGRVPHPCDRTTTWQGVGHELVQGQGPLNRFGRDFLNNGKKWTPTLCKADSDGDGRTNGEELGDPNCTWVSSSSYTPSVTNLTFLSHPGVCEPVNSTQCASANRFLLSIDVCAIAMNATSSDENWCPAIKSDDVKYFDLRFNQTHIPSNDTVYFCQQFDIPNNETYQIIAWEPIIDNYELLHHLILFSCDSLGEMHLARRPYHTPDFCMMQPMECPNMTFVWAYGQNKRCYSDDVGIPMGKDEFRVALLQLHYNNPSKLSNAIDSSGVRVYYTKKTRPSDGAMMSVGQIDINVRPNSKTKVTAKSFLTDNCNREALGPPGQKYYLNSMLFHMHKIGVHGKLLIRKPSGQTVKIVDSDIDYDRPVMYVWNNRSEAPMLESGDNFEIECSYQSDSPDYTFFGERTNDEMCFAFIELYPRPQNMSFQKFFNVDDMNRCLFENNKLVNKTLHECENPGSFSAEIWSIANSTEFADFMRYCEPEDYPATKCTRGCYLFLKKHNFLANPCMKGSVFRFYAGFVISPNYADVYRVQSQTDLCLSLKEEPAEDNNKSSTNKNSRSAAAGLPTTSVTGSFLVAALMAASLLH